MVPIRCSRPLSRVTLPFSKYSLFTIRHNSNSTPSKTDQTLTLPDGRTLGFAEYGTPRGTPLLFFHGFPSCRLEAAGIAPVVKRRNIRLISIDRPGFGLSTFQPSRRITDWPADVEALTRHLGLSRFAVLGGSGGGPYALACAHALPREKLSGVGMLASAGPWTAGIKEVPWISYFTYLGATYTPHTLESLTNGTIKSLKWALSTKPVIHCLDTWLNSMQRDKPSTNTPEISTTERRTMVLNTIFGGFTQGSAAFVQEAQILSQDWGFRFEDVKYDKVRIWHGRKDVNVPISMIRYMAGRLPRCELKEYDENHFTVVHRLDEVLDDLIGSEGGPDVRTQ